MELNKTSSNLLVMCLASAALTAAGCGGSGDGGRSFQNNSSFSYTTAYGTGASHALTFPDAITTDAAGNIYVANYGNPGVPRITKFDPNGNYIMEFGTAGTPQTGQLQGPQGVYVDAAGNVYVADTSNTGQIVVYDSTGKWKANYLSGSVGPAPYQITGDASGNMYVAFGIPSATSAPSKGYVLKFDNTGKVLGVFGQTEGAGQTLIDADGVAVDPSGNMFVSDYGAKRIVEYSSNGAYITSFGNTGSFRLQAPQGITYSPTLGFFVADLTTAPGFVYHYNSSGTYIERIGDVSGPGQLSNPYDVHFDSSGRLLVVDESHNRVAVYTLKTGLTFNKSPK